MPQTKWRDGNKITKTKTTTTDSGAGGIYSSTDALTDVNDLERSDNHFIGYMKPASTSRNPKSQRSSKVQL